MVILCIQCALLMLFFFFFTEKAFSSDGESTSGLMDVFFRRDCPYDE